MVEVEGRREKEERRGRVGRRKVGNKVEKGSVLLFAQNSEEKVQAGSYNSLRVIDIHTDSN